MVFEMTARIKSNFLDLFDKKTFGVLSTLEEDGSPQSSVIWIDINKEYILFNSIKKRQKYKNIKRDPRVSLLILDPENNYRYLEIRGIIEKISTKGAEEFVDKLAKRYMGKETYPYHRPGITRVIYYLQPEKVHYYEE